MLGKLFKKLFVGKKETKKPESVKVNKGRGQKPKIEATRIGELGEYKINIQLDQLPKEYRYLSDFMIENPKSRSGYSQIDHVVFTPYGLFIIETKNYEGIIKGKKNEKSWSVNYKFRMLNPFFQNYGHVEAVKSSLNMKKELKMFSLVSFTRRCTFKVDLELRDIKSDALIVYDTELSEFIHRKMNVEKLLNGDPIYTEEDIQLMYSQLEKANITDPLLRKKHIELIKKSSNQDDSIGQSCIICQKPVSNKVKAFCLGNKKRFNGKIYCYDHQKKAQ
ncbi:nuclease-related domain-containing protein [Halobacillus seohaensis]|uniref:Nuclease-related domain-containing protein n=1 Tax=Halobacillus seohaensis TaxID=447421 RepID=A0ABW2ERU7_9BACI